MDVNNITIQEEWILNRLSLEQIEKIEREKNRSINILGSNPFVLRRNEWEEFKLAINEGDELAEFNSNNMWSATGPRVYPISGYCIIRDKKVIHYFLTVYTHY